MKQSEVQSTQHEEHHGRWHRFLMASMGPAQVGPFDEAVVRPVVDEICPACRSPRSAHKVVREPGLSWCCCPKPNELRPEHVSLTSDVPAVGAAVVRARQSSM